MNNPRRQQPEQLVLSSDTLPFRQSSTEVELSIHLSFH
jgi:hypothetical protein